MKEIVEFIAKSIVNLPDEVVVTEETTEEGITVKLQVAEEDKGRVIGKQGRVAESIRTLLRVKAAKQGTRRGVRHRRSRRICRRSVGTHLCRQADREA